MSDPMTHPCAKRCWRIGAAVDVPAGKPCPECGAPWPSARINTVTDVRLTPAQIRRLQATGWEPGEMALAEGLVQAVEEAKRLRLVLHVEAGLVTPDGWEWVFGSLRKTIGGLYVEVGQSMVGWTMTATDMATGSQIFWRDGKEDWLLDATDRAEKKCAEWAKEQEEKGDD